MQEPPVRPEPVEACPEGTRRGPPPRPHSRPPRLYLRHSPTLLVIPAHAPRHSSPASSSFQPTLLVIPAKAGIQRGGKAGRPRQQSRSHPRLSTPCRRGGSRTARPAAAGPSPHRHQHPRRPTPPLVVPANAGIQGRGAAWGLSVRPRIPHSPPYARYPSPFPLSLSKGRCRAPALARPPTVGAVREPPVPPPAGIHPDTSPSRQRRRPSYHSLMEHLTASTFAPWNSSPARSASMTAWGSAPQSRELFQHRGAFLHLLCSCNASHQLQSECKDKLSTATRRRKNIASLSYAGP